VLRIRDVIVRIQIRIRRSVPIDGSRSGSFLQWLSYVFLCITYRYCWYIYVSLQRLQVIKHSQNCGNQGFPEFFWLVDGRIRIRNNNYVSGSWRPKTYVSVTLTKTPATFSTARQTPLIWAGIRRLGSILSWIVILSVYGANTIAIDLSLSALIS
jgi:hypothetical protein